MKQKWFLVVSVFLIAALLGACNSKEEAKEEVEQASISDEEKLKEDALVVTVNDDEVTGMTYNLVYTQLKLHALQTGQELSDESIREMTIESLIDRQLLLQQAEAEGIVVTEEEAAEELKQIKEENEEALQSLLEQYQITESLFQHQLVFEMTMNEYIEEKLAVEVTKDEVKEIYEEIKEENEELPELTEIYDSLKSQIENQKTSEQLQTTIDELKESSAIEIHL